MLFYEVEFIHTIQPTLYEIPTESSSVNNVKQKNVYIAIPHRLFSKGQPGYIN